MPNIVVEGAEAAAATAIVARGKCISREKFTSFIVDRTFQFYIRDNISNLVLFEGVF